MIHLESDYNNGAHPAVLRHLAETNDQRTDSYGSDHFSAHAIQLIRDVCRAPEADIWLLTGGTQTNATIIDSVLQPYEGVVCCESAHINVHEAGAVEYTGHKVLVAPSTTSPQQPADGKLHPEDLSRLLSAYFADPTAEHMVRPGMVYITFPTELGTLYTADELAALHAICRQWKTPLYVDGARLAYGLAASSDVNLPLLAAHTDIFTIGGTKCGALCGEAVVFPHGQAPAHMLSRIKQHGALLAKSRLAGAQFEALFSPAEPACVYATLGQSAVSLAMRLRHHFTRHLHYPLFIDSPTNQQFFVIPDSHLATLRSHIGFETWAPADEGHTVCRFVTSWATTEQEMEQLEALSAEAFPPQ